MIWPFRPRETVPDGRERHQTTLDLIEQVAALRGQVRSIESEWDSMREQIKKGYQRMEKANERAEKRLATEELLLEDVAPLHGGDEIPLTGFAKKLQEIKEG